MNPVVHFVVPYDDSARVVRSYQEALGGQMQPLAIPGNGEYLAFMDSENNRAGLLQPLPRR